MPTLTPLTNRRLCQVGTGQHYTTRGLQVLVHVSMYQGSILGIPSLDPHPGLAVVLGFLAFVVHHHLRATSQPFGVRCLHSGRGPLPGVCAESESISAAASGCFNGLTSPEYWFQAVNQGTPKLVLSDRWAPRCTKGQPRGILASICWTK